MGWFTITASFVLAVMYGMLDFLIQTA